MARKIAMETGAIHYENDMYLVDSKGNYNWTPDAAMNGAAWCLSQTCKALSKGDSVVVSNTFTRRVDMLPYLCMAQMGKISVEVIEATGKYQNIHNVPEETLNAMAKRYEILTSIEV